MYGRMGGHPAITFASLSAGGFKTLAAAVFGVYDVTNHGIQVGSGAVLGALNTAALEALVATVAEAGGGTLYVPPGGIPLVAGTDVNHGQGGAPTIWLVGHPSISTITWHGTNGPFLRIATDADSRLNESGMRDLKFFHADGATTGADIVIGDVVGGFTLERVLLKRAENPPGTPVGAHTGVQLGSGSFSGGGVAFKQCKIELRTDAVNGIGIAVANTANATATGGFSLIESGIDGVKTSSIGIKFTNGDGAGNGKIDTIFMSRSSIKDHSIAIHIPGTCRANIENVFCDHMILDECQDYCLLAQPGAGASIGNWNWTVPWMSSDGTNVQLDESNGGVVSDWEFLGGETHNATLNIFNLGEGLRNIQLANMRLGSVIQTAGRYGVDVAGAAGAGEAISVVNCPNISVLSGADGALRMSTAVEPFVVAGNTYRGVDASVPADNGTSKRNAYNAFFA